MQLPCQKPGKNVDANSLFSGSYKRRRIGGLMIGGRVQPKLVDFNH
jgi:hypothetical protein